MNVLSTRRPDNEKLILDFFASMGPTLNDVLSAYERFMHPQAVWTNCGFPDCVGIDAMKALLVEQKRLFNFERVVVLKQRLLASCGDNVFFERRDSIADPAGNVLYAFDILGVFEIQNARIMSWRDYMDTSQLRSDWLALQKTHGISGFTGPENQ